jgi:signal transduction histidine kinase
MHALEYILQNMGDAFVHLNREWKYVFVNTKALALMNKKKDDLVGKEIWEVFPDIIGGTFETEFRKAVELNIDRSFEIYYDTYAMWLEVRASPNVKGLSIFYTNISARKLAEEKNKENEQLIVKAILNAQEKERYLIGQELHDNINQILAGTLLSLAMTNHRSGDQSSIRIQESMEYINKAIDEIRKLSHRLAPASFDNTTFTDAVHELIRSFNVNNRFQFRVNIDESINKGINSNIQLNFYRVLQEQLNNILRHSRARLVEISIYHKINSVIMRVYDNGKGFDPAAVRSGIGLNNIRKRVESFSGTFTLHSQKGQGCELLIEIPI